MMAGLERASGRIFSSYFRPFPPSLVIGNEIGRGAYGAVYDGKLEGLPVAVKKMHQVLLDFSNSVVGECFEAECRILEGLTHPHIIGFVGAFYDVQLDEPLLVTERLKENLRNLLRRVRKLSLLRQLKICLGIASGLEYLHSRSPLVVHRDLSDRNVMLSAEGVVKIIDFAQAKFKGSCEDYFRTSAPGGVFFMPPEALGTTPHYTEKIDVFSLGVLMLEICTGRYPSDSVKLTDIGRVSEIVRRAEDLSKLDDGHPLKPFILQCLGDDYEQRPSAATVRIFIASKKAALIRQGMTEDDRSALLKSHYEDALKKHASVSIEVIRALFVGPSGAGKSSLRHLLVHGESKEMRTSTPVMETPDIVVFSEHYTMDEGSSIWTPVSESCLNQSVKRCAEEKHYQECAQYPTSIGNTTKSASAQPRADVVQDPNQLGISRSQSTGNTLVQTIVDNVFANTQIPHDQLQSDEFESLEFAHVELLDSFAFRDNTIRLDKASFLHVIDSGGQPVFQDILPLLLAIPCTYIQVFDASKDFHEPIKTTYRPQEGVELPLSSSQPLETQWEFIQHSLSSMQTMAHKFACKDLEIFKSTCPEPRIIIAGTFKDKVLASGKGEEIISNVKQRIKSLEGKPYFRHIQRPDSSGFFLVDNHMTFHSKGAGEGVDLAYLNKLRKCISNKSGVLKLDVPLMWFLLELVTGRIDKKFFKEDELKHFCLKNGYIDQSKADGQFFCLLKLLHVLGFYAYFDLDPQYLRGSANYVCTDATALYREVSKLLAVQYTPAPSGTTEEFKTTGIIHHSYAGLLSELGIITDVDPVWFLEVLHHVGIAARLTPSRDPPSYFIPSCLPYRKAKVPAYSSVGPLCITFVFEQDSFTTHCDLPRSVFCRLVVELANREWKVVLPESDRKSVKFSFLEARTHVYLTEKPGHIQCQVVIDESAALSSLPDPLQEIHHHCSAIRTRLEENLHHITQQVFGEKFQKIAQIQPVLPCSCQPDVRYTAPVDDSGVATCFHCGSFPKLPPSQKVWFSPPDPSEAMVRVVRETGVAFWKLEEVSTVDADTSDSTDGTTSPLDGASQTDLNDKCPSDVGVLGILKHIPLWYKLAVSLGVPIAQVNAYRLDPEMGGGMSLLHWRNGRCEGGFPNTWGFLLETVEKLQGPVVAKRLRGEAERDKTWSLN